ncbi:MAG: hypothetical protein KDC71_05380, partial [Acidobacteria bacterium]|nr:hypothetical protein [Acidobacteriota bacterium]
AALAPFFKTGLTLINRGGHLKTRLFHFIQSEIEKGTPIPDALYECLVFCSLSHAKSVRDPSVACLRDLAEKQGKTAACLTLEPFPTKEPRYAI